MFFKRIYKLKIFYFDSAIGWLKSRFNSKLLVTTFTKAFYLKLNVNRFEEAKKKNADLKTQLDVNISTVGDLKKELEDTKKEVNDLQKTNSDLDESSKKDVNELNNKVDKLKEEKKEKEEIIDKMEEEKKSMQAEIENFERISPYLSEYIIS